ncbi:endonuclease III domain-containing protein [Sphingomonas sp.]|uniref:endonuclease III domain-containing protein n=1 Tax=Sphingomonas sp. TaxID=28214 RepID=UPI003B3A53F1
MQMAFGFGASDYARWQARLAPVRASLTLLPPRRPLDQLAKSMISGRTRDAVSQRAFDRLIAWFTSAARLADANVREVEAAIAEVTFAADKASYIVEAMRRLRAGPFGFRLEALAAMPLGRALAFLETLPGVGRKVAASTLNAGTLGLPVMIVDTHVLRVLRRLGAVDARADTRAASEAVTAAMPGWRGADFLAFHVGLKRLGQTLCRAEAAPLCDACPLADTCLRFAGGGTIG